MNQITRLDTNALNRALIGFDRLFDNFDSRFANQISSNYPPYNIVKKDNDFYYIEIAVAGFNKDEISVEVDNSVITVKGAVKRDDEPVGQYLYRGLSARDFSRQFQMSEHMVVKSATIQNGVLTIEMERVIPEEKKPRVIDIVEVK